MKILIFYPSGRKRRGRDRYFTRKRKTVDIKVTWDEAHQCTDIHFLYVFILKIYLYHSLHDTPFLDSILLTLLDDTRLRSPLERSGNVYDNFILNPNKLDTQRWTLYTLQAHQSSVTLSPMTLPSLVLHVAFRAVRLMQRSSGNSSITKDVSLITVTS